MAHRRVAAALVAVALTTAGTSAAIRATRPDRSDEPAAGSNARRFLDLTGAGSGAYAKAKVGRGSGAVDADAGRAAPVDGDRTPQGWRIRPAGQSIDVLRFPLGIAATADGSTVLVSSDSGGPQGLTTIDATSPKPTAKPTLAANLFMGVAATPTGEVFASGGNADRGFRFRLAGPVVANPDAAEG